MQKNYHLTYEQMENLNKLAETVYRLAAAARRICNCDIAETAGLDDIIPVVDYLKNKADLLFCNLLNLMHEENEE